MTRIRHGLTERNIRINALYAACNGQHVFSGKTIMRVPPRGGEEAPMPVCDTCGVPVASGRWMDSWKIRDWRDAA